MKGFASVLLPALAVASPILTDASTQREAAPLLSSVDAKVIPNSYMVVFKDHVSKNDASAHHKWVQSLHQEVEESRMELRKRSQFPLVDEIFEGLKHTFHIPGQILGYSGHFDDEVVEKVRSHPDVSASSQPAEHVLALKHGRAQR